MSGAGIAAIVVSHDSAETLEDCLSRLRAADGVVEIRVVDNDSRDGTLDIVQRMALADPRLRFIANPDNPGFAVACNQGASDSQAATLTRNSLFMGRKPRPMAAGRNSAKSTKWANPQPLLP